MDGTYLALPIDRKVYTPANSVTAYTDTIITYNGGKVLTAVTKDDREGQ